MIAQLFGRRRHLFEFHEQPWFPEVWRDLFRAGLGRSFVLLGLSRPMADVVSRFLRTVRPDEVLDLCSGSGELSADVFRRAVEAAEIDDCALFLSDMFPDARRWAEHAPAAHHCHEPVDVNAIGDESPRARMILNALHHFSADEVRALLATTAESADGFCAVDLAGRSAREVLLTVSVVPIAAAMITAFMHRPLRARNLFWGVFVPIIPFVAVFDGVVSILRGHTVEELQSITAELSDTFVWEIGRTGGGPGSPEMIYVIGVRRRGEGDA